MGLSPVKLGTGPCSGCTWYIQADVQRGAVKQLLDSHEQDFRSSLRNAKVATQDVVVSAIPNNRGCACCSRSDSLPRARAAILDESRTLNFKDVKAGIPPALEMQLTRTQEIKGGK